MNNKCTKLSLMIEFILCPFLVSGAFYVSPWLGVPTLVVLGLYWIGVLQSIAETGSKGRGG